MADLSVVVNDLVFKNPIILGSSGLTYDERGIISSLKKGYSAVVTKSYTWNPCKGTSPTATTSCTVASPRAFFERGRWITGMEAAFNPGYEKGLEAVKLSKPVAKEERAYIVAQIEANSIEQWVEMAQGFERAGADIIELNMVCPASVFMSRMGIPGFDNLGLVWSKNPEKAAAAIKAVKNAVDIPVWPKISTPTLRVPQNLSMFEEARADAFSFQGNHGLFNYEPLFIDIETGKQYGTPPRKTVQGPIVFPFTLNLVAELVQKTKKPLLPSGGIINGIDVLKCFMVGTTAVQICTISWWDRFIVSKMLPEMEAFMDRKGYSTLNDIRGMSLKYLNVSEEEIRHAYQEFFAEPESKTEVKEHSEAQSP